MTFSYDGALFCDSCGERVPGSMQHWGEIESDNIDHCDNEAGCLEAIDLELPADAPLYGCESRKVGAICTDRLTSEGIEYIRGLIAEPNPTPYQKALHTLWLDTFPVLVPETFADMET